MEFIKRDVLWWSFIAVMTLVKIKGSLHALIPLYVYSSLSLLWIHEVIYCFHFLQKRKQRHRKPLPWCQPSANQHSSPGRLIKSTCIIILAFHFSSIWAKGGYFYTFTFALISHFYHLCHCDFILKYIYFMYT